MILPLLGALSGTLVLLGLSVGVSTVRSLRKSSLARMTDFEMPRTIDAPAGLDRGLAFDAPAAVEHLEAAGFRRAGSYRFTLPSHTAVFAVLLDPTGSITATVTPGHISLGSEYGGKVFTTSSTAMAAPMDFQLQQGVATVDVDRLLGAHRTGIDRIAEVTGHLPEHLTLGTARDTAMAIERYSIRSFSAIQQGFAAITSSGRKVKPSPIHSDKAIRAWHDSADRWEWLP